MKENDLQKRAFDFAVNVVNLLKKVERSSVSRVIEYQLAKAATSIGANYEESQAACSKDDFSYKVAICLKEARESHYWLRVMRATNIGDVMILDELIREAGELKQIFGAIVLKSKNE